MAVLPPNLRVGKITLQGGNVNFSDFFIKPNYSANLTGVGGSVTEITTDKPGDLELRAKIDNTAPVEIPGKINPLAKDLFLDIKAERARHRTVAADALLRRSMPATASRRASSR